MESCGSVGSIEGWSILAQVWRRSFESSAVGMDSLSRCSIRSNERVVRFTPAQDAAFEVQCVLPRSDQLSRVVLTSYTDRAVRDYRPTLILLSICFELLIRDRSRYHRDGLLVWRANIDDYEFRRRFLFAFFRCMRFKRGLLLKYLMQLLGVDGLYRLLSSEECELYYRRGRYGEQDEGQNRSKRGPKHFL